MPSFLNDENSPIFQNHADILDLDPHRHFSDTTDNHAPVQDKNGKVLTGEIPHQPRSSAINEPFDETSNSSIHDSETSDAAPMTVNGNGTRPTSMSSLTNGRSATGGSDAKDTKDDNINFKDAHPLVNGTSIPDRSISRRPVAGVNGVGASELGDYQTHQNNSSAVPPAPRTVPADQSHKDSMESAATPTLTRPYEGEISPKTQTMLAPPSSQTTEAGSPKSTHRYSSPPVYQPGGSSANSSAHLQPPGPGTLKQRHTLEVPKLTPGRQSKDGMDTAQASGRFSPTVANSMPRRASLSLARRTTRSMQLDTPRDEVVPDEDAIRWAEAYRQKRASKRKRKEEEDDDRVLVGTKVDETHANWVTAYNMLTGIRVSVSRTNAKLDREVNDEDFDVKQKSTFDIAGNELIPSAKYDFKFKDYAPWVFRRLRSSFRLDPADYLMSLTGKYILSELGSPGKSGSFFYFSRDYKYIIKTIHHAEHKFLRKILKEYYQHVQENPNTLLSQFYGLHRVKLPYGKKIHFVVMNNLFPPHRDIHTTFDLKGSTIGRDYKEENLAENPRATLKDLNWLRRKRQLELGLQKKRLFLEQLQRDVLLLKRLGIMDYSLLIGIHDLSRGNEENLRDKTLAVFNPGGEKSPEDEPPSVLLRTPSKAENARKARDLRQMIRSERPVPLGQSLGKMSDDLGEGRGRPGFVFNQDDGGFRATHEDNTPADEIYYLGVIDCLTHYGMIKKIEHFWKGLTSDRTQISALPPDQYGDRFFNFIEGITMSIEEAQREEVRRREEETVQNLESRLSNKSSTRGKSHHAIPPMPNHLPPAPPPGSRSPEARETVDMAAREAQRTEQAGANEKNIPERILKTVIPLDKRDSALHEPVLPAVEEAGEHSRDDSDARPLTPAKNKMLPPTRAPPPTPPKGALGKPESADSGYAGNVTVNNGAWSSSGKTQQRPNRESINKTLPPLPKSEETDDSGVRMVA